MKARQPKTPILPIKLVAVATFLERLQNGFSRYQTFIFYQP